MENAKAANYPCSAEVYKHVKDTPNNGVTYNVAAMHNKYESKAASSIILTKFTIVN